MKNLIRLIVTTCKRSFSSLLISLLLLISSTAEAIDLQCKLVEYVRFKPTTIALMQEAANNGYLYRVHVDTSNVSFKVNHFPFSTVEGRFSEFEGGLALPQEIAKSKQELFIIKVASVTTGDDDLNDYLKSSAFFNADQFPVIMFISTGFEWVNKTTARLVGNLTLHGMTKPLVFDVAIDTTENTGSDKNEKLTMLANAEINRSDFGMHGMQLLVSDKVNFRLKIEAYRMPG